MLLIVDWSDLCVRKLLNLEGSLTAWPLVTDHLLIHLLVLAKPIFMSRRILSFVIHDHDAVLLKAG